ncbi:hypothetical protein [Polluticoccus soli]|uniref:hypothetical protein n=1 Tax=Polluticoccus soli TaxID=3034150 RepID=UPI0023E16A92|nr:hypothetical protein [Flavipsychrobacter sp. JY13-12]
MKLTQSILAVIFMVAATSCGDMKGGDNNNGGDEKPKTYGTAAEAAEAGKADMLKAMENGVNFGVDRAKLESSKPGQPIMKQAVDFNALLQADSSTNLERMTTGEAVTAVPFIIGPEVVSIMTLRNEGNQFAVGTLGDAQLSTELNTVSQATGGAAQGKVTIYEIPNLNATVYAVGDSAGILYYTSYNNLSPRQPLRAPELMRMLQAEAQNFQKQFGDEIKKGKLVR